MSKMVDTNMGTMPLEDYLDIRAMQNGFEDYEDMKRHGYCIKCDSYYEKSDGECAEAT